MRAKLPIIGLIATGKDADFVPDIPAEIEKLFDLGGMLEFNGGALSDSKTISSKILLANRGWVYRNNDAIAQEVSKMEFELYTIGLDKGEIVYNEVTSHPLLDLLDKPNEETTKTDSIYIIQSHKKLAGDAFWLKIRNGGKVVGLRSLPPDKITLDLQTPSETDPTIIKAYVYKDVIDGANIKIVYDPNDIIHFKKPNPNNSFRGLGAVEALADAIDLDNLTTETAKKFYLNGAITNFALSTDEKVSDEQVQRLQQQFRSKNAGVGNAYKTMILGSGLKPVSLAPSNKENQFLDQLAWYRDKIMIGFGNTPASLGIVEDVNRANAEATLGMWLRNTVKPDMEAIVNTLNEFLVPEFGEKLVLGFKDPVPEDRDDDVAEVKNLYPIGIMTLNEAREAVDLDPVEGEGGDEFYRPPTPVVNEELPDEEA